MMQVPNVSPQYLTVPQPNYNAVKIDINNPQVNAQPGYTQAPVAPMYTPTQAPVTAPMYAYPQAQIYELPQQSIYQPKAAVPKSVKEAPAVPQPVIIAPAVVPAPVIQAPVVQAPVVKAPEVKAPVVVPPVAPAVPVVKVTQTMQPATAAQPASAVEATAPVKPAVVTQTVEVKAPEVVAPKLDLNAFIGKLTSPDLQQQEIGMEAIAELAKNNPAQATELVDVKVIDSLLGIMEKDTTKLEGPTPQQMKIREKIMTKQQVSDAEMAEAMKISPMEQAERNKQYSIYTVAILQKLYASEVQKMTKNVVPLTELPGIAGIVEQLKGNPNPMIRAAAIDALNHIKAPEYKADLTTLFTIAKNDKDPLVKEVATKSLEDISKQ